MTEQVLRFTGTAQLVDRAAALLTAEIVALQAQADRVVHLALTGGRIAQRFYEVLGERLDEAGVDAARLELWWTDDRFAATDDPARHAGPALAQLAGRFQLDPARTHPMPAADGVVDADVAAATYAKELDGVTFDFCLLSIGPEGHVAGIFPDHPSFDASSANVIGLAESPKGEVDRISLTVPTLNRSREVWFLISGRDKSAAAVQALGGDPQVPAGVVRGQEQTRWFIDREAGAGLPWFTCSL